MPRFATPVWRKWATGSRGMEQRVPHMAAAE